MVDHSQDNRGYETTDVHMKPIVVLGVILAVASIAAFVLMAVLFGTLEFREYTREAPLSPLANPNPLPPEPRLQVTPGDDLELYLGESERRLNHYEWIDKDAGVVRIPIDRAMELTLERGLQSREISSSQTEGLAVPNE